ncbi:hypothetical protein FF80_03296 [Devosia sp. LC5]|uniref:hypothetical protein n=1 Tax=Devosia sp. LC5 TaxID=1502724 RepID=UPI0004E32A98|nr:hypothetical protein [Devosia sp. LC5]KFC62729.1 hypothetical protein FF80_03296 [Devosia sp. LC5]
MSSCTCLEVFGEDPDCPLHSYDALEARIADLEELIAAQHGDVVVRVAKLLYDKDDKIAAMSASLKGAREALKRQKANIEHWLETGEAASPEESKSIYDQICAALPNTTGEAE